MVGDGMYFVAIAFEAYALSNRPITLTLVGLAWTLPTVALLPIGGAVGDRAPRRRVIVLASTVEALAIATIAVLVLIGHLTVWLLVLLVAVYGGAVAFFTPAFEGLLPTLLPTTDLPAGTAIDQIGRRLGLQIVGPALGGVLAALHGPEIALALDAMTFLAPICSVALISPSTSERPTSRAGLLGDVRGGLRFVRATPWLWATLSAASLGLLAFFGPYQVLLPFLVKNGLHDGGAAYGLIQASWGIGAVVSAALVGQKGIPRRQVTVMYGAWALQVGLLAGFAAGRSVAVFAGVACASGACGAAGNVIWATLMRMLVPNELLGRVSSLDWLTSSALIPLSFALTGPIAATVGVRTTLLAAGLLGSAALLCFLLVPGVRAPEQPAEAISIAEPS